MRVIISHILNGEWRQSTYQVKEMAEVGSFLTLSFNNDKVVMIPTHSIELVEVIDK